MREGRRTVDDEMVSLSLKDEGIESVSLNPDTVVDTWLRLAKHRKG